MVVHDRTRLNDRLRHFLSFQHSSCTTQSKSRIPGDQWLPVSSYLCVRAETSRGTRGTAADIVVPAVSGARIPGKDLRLLWRGGCDTEISGKSGYVASRLAPTAV